MIVVQNLAFALGSLLLCKGLIICKWQVFAYALMSAGSAASGVTNLNRTGIRHTALPNFCKPLQSFCDHVAISIAFTFFSCILLATSAVQDVIWLSKNWIFSTHLMLFWIVPLYKYMTLLENTISTLRFLQNDQCFFCLFKTSVLEGTWCAM